jgi:ribonuclease P protein component
VLAPTQRLRSSADFSSVVSRGRRAGSPAIVVHLLGPDPDHGTRAPARCGFVVSKAVGNAVTRNRVVRRLRPLVRKRLPDLPEGSLMVVRALPAAAGASSSELSAALDRCLRKLAGPSPQAGGMP